MAAARQDLPVRLDRAPQRGAAFALTRASRRARTRSIGSCSRATGSSLIFDRAPAVAPDRGVHADGYVTGEAPEAIGSSRRLSNAILGTNSHCGAKQSDKVTSSHAYLRQSHGLRLLSYAPRAATPPPRRR